MCDIKENSFGQKGGFGVHFNQDLTSIAVVSVNGYRLFQLASVDNVKEIYCSNNEETKIAERLFSSSLVATVTTAEPKILKICHFKKGTEICNYIYPDTILNVKLNRSRLVVCLRDSVFIHNIRDMKLLHSIDNLPSTSNGLCSLSLNSYLAYPISSTAGELQIFNGDNLSLKCNIKAHESLLSAMNFSYNGTLLATASSKGTVIRIFCVKNGQKVHEFRRGVKRHVNIASLNFSICANYVCVSSNTETVHIFKIDTKSIETAERRDSIENEDNNCKRNSASEKTWMMGLISKAVSNYLPTNVTDVFHQDRAFATVQLIESGLKYECVLAKLQKETKLLIACEDGFLYIYNFDDAKGGECKLARAHDLRTPMHDLTELHISEPRPDATNELIITSINHGSYAGVLKGRPKDQMSESDKFRDLKEAVEGQPRSSIKIFDHDQFPPVTAIAAE